MARTIVQQSVVLPAPAAKLFEMFVDPKGHEAITGKPVIISETPGSEFRAFDGALSGTMLTVIRHRLVVMSWRSVAFKPENPDSTLILTFTAEGSQGRIDLVHLDVPDHELQGVKDGWPKHYWNPWREYLSRK